METPVVIFLIAMIIIVALIIYMFMLGSSKYDPVEKAKEDAYFKSLLNKEQVKERVVEDLKNYTHIIYN